MERVVESYLEPIDIFDKIGERKSELPDKELGFICALIKNYRPRKIVEIGVSAGGTSCVILNCLDKLGLSSEVYSVDLSYTYHYDPSKECGYQIKDAAKYLESSKRHKLFLGRTIAEVIEEISVDGPIDFLILDTIHYLPGELLDFLVCLPFLAENAVIVLDDLKFAHTGENTAAIATKILFDVIVADKMYPEGNVYPKLAAFCLNEDTRKYKTDYFSALVTPWWYMVDKREFEPYSNIIKKYYNEEENWLFEEALEINSSTIKRKENVGEDIDRLLRLFDTNTKVFIYGAGKRGSALGKFLADRGKKVAGYIISDGRDKKVSDGMQYNVFHLSEVKNFLGGGIVIVAAASHEIDNILKDRNINFVRAESSIFPFIKEYCQYLLSV